MCISLLVTCPHKHGQAPPWAKVQVTADSDPDTGLNDLIERQSDGIMYLGPLGEDAKEEARERGLTLETQLIGWSGVAVVTHPQNPVDSLTIEQLRKIFLGEITNWKEVGGLDEPIVPITRDEAISGTERLFRQFVLKGFPVAQNTVRLFDYDVVSAISKQHGSIADARLREGIRGRIKGLVKVIAIRNDEASPPVLPSVRHPFRIRATQWLLQCLFTTTPCQSSLRSESLLIFAATGA